MTTLETIMWCIGHIEGALHSTDQSVEHKDNVLSNVRDKLVEAAERERMKPW